MIPIVRVKGSELEVGDLIVTTAGLFEVIEGPVMDDAKFGSFRRRCLATTVYPPRVIKTIRARQFDVGDENTMKFNTGLKLKKVVPAVFSTETIARTWQDIHLVRDEDVTR